MSLGHFFLMMLCCLIWAGSFIMGKQGVETFPPVLFAALRYGVLCLLLMPFLRIYKGQMSKIIAVALFQGALHISFFYMGMNGLENMSVVALAVQMEVPFTMVLSVLILREQIGWRRKVGFLFCVAGMVIMSYDPAVFNFRSGIIFILLSSLMAACGTILMRQIEGVPVFRFQAWIACVSAPILLLGTLLFESGQWAAIETATPAAWSSVLYGSLAATLGAYGLFYYLLQRYEVSLLSLLTSLVPVFGVALVTSIRGDSLSQQMVIGGVAIIAGAMVIIERTEKKSDIEDVPT